MFNMVLNVHSSALSVLYKHLICPTVTFFFCQRQVALSFGVPSYVVCQRICPNNHQGRSRERVNASGVTLLAALVWM